MDDLIIQFIETEEKETELFFSAINSMERYDIASSKISWPKPTATELWFEGLKKYGRVFADREYELREKRLKEKKCK